MIKGVGIVERLLIRACDEGFPVNIIYSDKDSNISKRSIIVKAVNDKYLKAFCLTKRQARIFKIESILAVDVIRKTAS